MTFFSVLRENFIVHIEIHILSSYSSIFYPEDVYFLPIEQKKFQRQINETRIRVYINT